jgi:hypothetical protein
MSVLNILPNVESVLNICHHISYIRPLLWSESMATDPEDRFRFPALPDFLSSGSRTGSTQAREYN